MDWTYEDFKDAVLKLTGIDLSSYKERQMKRRIDSFISRNGYSSYQDYFRALSSDAMKQTNFIDYITINVSEFFRNPDQWEILDKQILPSLLQKYRDLKIWCAACSTGEEPYSLAMLLSRYLPKNPGNRYRCQCAGEGKKRYIQPEKCQQCTGGVFKQVLQ